MDNLSFGQKARRGVLAAPLVAALWVTAAFAQAGPAETAVTAGATSLQSELVGIGVAVLPLAAVVVAISMGWRFAKRFFRG